MKLDGAALDSVLHSESAALTALVALLRTEQLTLIKGDLDRLAAIAESKAGYLFELSRLGEQRQLWLRERKLSADRAGMESLLRAHAGNSPHTRAAWQQLLELMQKARQLNDTNGALIGGRLNGTQRALNVLFSAANIAGAYAPDGSTVSLRTAHELAVA